MSVSKAFLSDGEVTEAASTLLSSGLDREMILIFGLIPLLLQSAACVERFCSFKQSDCYAALGHKLNLLMVDARIYFVTVKTRKNNTEGPVCRVKNDTISPKQCGLFINRTEVTIINGTVIINPVKREDSGNYTLLQRGADDKETTKVLLLHVEAPVGSVEVSITCSSNQTKLVSCSSKEGDQLLYSWTLNGKPMTGNTSIQLEEGTEGKITCTVRNHVSEVNKTADIKDCPGTTTGAPTSPETTTKNGTTLSTSGTNSTSTPPNSTSTSPILLKLLPLLPIGLGTVAGVLILLFAIVFCIYRKKDHKPTPAPAGDVELVYAQISHQKSNKKSSGKKIESSPAADVEYAAVRPQTKRKKKKEEEIQYGEVTFTPKTSNAQQQQKPMEESIYSQVQSR